MKAIQILGLAFALVVSGIADAQTYRINNRSLTPQRGELTAKQAYDKATAFYRAIEKNIKNHRFHMELTGYGNAGRTWEVVTAKGIKSDSNLNLDPKTGRVLYYVDTDIEQEERGNARIGKKLTKEQYTGKIKKFLERMGQTQDFTSINVSVGKGGKPRATALIYETHKDVPVRGNYFSFSLRASDGAFGLIQHRRRVEKFDDAAKVKKTERFAQTEIQKVAGNRKPVALKLWYARLQKDRNEFLSDVARPVYIAEFANREEIWLDAESGKIVRNYARP